VGKVSAVRHPTRPTQPSIPPGSVNVITWIIGLEIIKRQTTAVWLFGRESKSVGAGLAYAL